jgi:hypothetical protein
MKHNVVESQLLGLVDEAEHLIIEIDPERPDDDVAVLSTRQGIDALLQAREGLLDGLVPAGARIPDV